MSWLFRPVHASLAGIARDLRVSDVHPPFYFWAVSLWRDVFGPSLFAARMLSVVCGLVSISLVGIIARRSAIQPVPVMLLTLGCYGFVYTNAIARGFAPAQMLILCAVALLLRQRTVLAGLCFGAASCCNYLAVFVGAAAILIAGAWPAVLAAIPFLALDGWFFAAQHARPAGPVSTLRVLAEPASAGRVSNRSGVWRIADVCRWHRAAGERGGCRSTGRWTCGPHRASPAAKATARNNRIIKTRGGDPSWWAEARHPQICRD